MKVNIDKATHTIKVIDVATGKSKNISIHTDTPTDELIKKMVEFFQTLD